MTFLDFFEHLSWSPGGHTSGHFRPLAAYTVTSLSNAKAKKMNHTNSSTIDCIDSNSESKFQHNKLWMKLYNYHWRVTE